MEIIAVNDTNIFIDLCNIGLLDEFFALPLQIHTTDFVVNELVVAEQKEAVLKFHLAERLVIKTYTAKEIVNIAIFQAQCDTNVSIADCSVWLYAKENNFRLITGDNKLRKSAMASGATVCGILYVFDQLVEFRIITPQQGYDKLKQLFAQNNRLPSKEIEKRLKLWR